MLDWRDLKMMMKALGDTVRLTIVYHLIHQQNITVTALTDLLNISQPLVSWHLRKLRRAGFITTRRVGRQVYCSPNAARFQQCQHLLERLIDPTFQVEWLPAGEALMETENLAEKQLPLE